MIAVPEPLLKENTDGMLTRQESEHPLISARFQRDQETGTMSTDVPEMLSDIKALLNMPGSYIATVEIPRQFDSTHNPHPEHSLKRVDNEQPISIAIAYADIDKRHKNHIERDLKTLRKQCWNIKWEAYDIDEAFELVADVANPLVACNLSLLLISPEFLSSDYCTDSLVSQVLRKHLAGPHWAAPVLLRPCLWQDTLNQVPGMRLPILPKGALPVTRWSSEDEAFLDIAKGIRRALEYLKGRL